MPLSNPEKLNNLITSGDITSLKSLALPVKRHLNRSLSFRSAMMISTHNLKHLSKIPLLDAECVMLNLEDGVSAEQKPFALALCAMALASNPESNKKLVVRVNPLDEGVLRRYSFSTLLCPMRFVSLKSALLRMFAVF